MNDPLDQKLSAHFKARKTTATPDRDFSARVLTALPPPRKAHAPARSPAWDGQLVLVSLIVAIVLLCIPFGGHASGLNILTQSVLEVSNWLSLSSLAIALGLTLATLILISDEDEIIPGWL